MTGVFDLPGKFLYIWTIVVVETFAIENFEWGHFNIPIGAKQYL